MEVINEKYYEESFNMGYTYRWEITIPCKLDNLPFPKEDSIKLLCEKFREHLINGL